MTYLVLAVHNVSRQLYPIDSYEEYGTATYAASLRKSTTNASVYIYTPENRMWFTFDTATSNYDPPDNWQKCSESVVPSELRAIALLHN